MQVFNAWYYSFSPSVAQFIASNDPIRAPIRVMLYPLLGVLGLSSLVYSLFSGAPEFGVVMTGLVASSLIGLVYLTLPALVGVRALRKRKVIAGISIARISMASLATALLLIAVGEFAQSFVLLAVGSSALVLTCIIAVPALVSLAILRTNPK
jgi:vacuolar-type H+-ATPase subunit I/STV1